MKKVEISLGGLDCANCARKIEEKVQNLDEVKSVNLNFIKRVLKFELNEEKEKEKVIKEVIEIIDATEPGLKIEVIDKNKKRKEIGESANNVQDGCMTGG